jgi:hypothetical protein
MLTNLELSEAKMVGERVRLRIVGGWMRIRPVNLFFPRIGQIFRGNIGALFFKFWGEHSGGGNLGIFLFTNTPTGIDGVSPIDPLSACVTIADLMHLRSSFCVSVM